MVYGLILQVQKSTINIELADKKEITPCLLTVSPNEATVVVSRKSNTTDLVSVTAQVIFTPM